MPSSLAPFLSLYHRNLLKSNPPALTSSNGFLRPPSWKSEPFPGGHVASPKPPGVSLSPRPLRPPSATWNIPGACALLLPALHLRVSLPAHSSTAAPCSGLCSNGSSPGKPFRTSPPHSHLCAWGSHHYNGSSAKAGARVFCSCLVFAPP